MESPVNLFYLIQILVWKVNKVVLKDDPAQRMT